MARGNAGLAPIPVAVMLALSSVSCGSGAAPSPPPATFSASVTVSNATPGNPLSRLLLGNNIEWSQGGDGLLYPGTDTENPLLLNPVLTLAPTVIRYPGGTLSDVYHWQAGVGPVASRGMLEWDTNGDTQTVYFGTQEYLTLCMQTGAVPLITVNVLTGTAEEAADWLTLTNVTGVLSANGQLLPKVPYWEIGNEPYIISTITGAPFTPQQYAAQAAVFLPALKVVDPTIIEGVPLASPDYLALAPASYYADFNSTVLSALTTPPDFFAVHDAYLPVGSATDLTSLYYSSVAGAEEVNTDLNNLRSQVQSYFPLRTVPFAITEMNSLYTLDGSASDQYPLTLTEAIYVADLLGVLANRKDILMADFWAILNNDILGSIGPNGNPRPGFEVLTAYLSMAGGAILPVETAGPTFTASAVGLFPGAENVPTVSAFAVNQSGKIELLLINKDIARIGTVTIEFQQPVTSSTATEQVLYTGDEFQAFPNGGLNWTPATTLALTNGVLTVSLQPHSIAMLQIP
jgi:alpha-N-arabinofuranosidase